jgi:hypothetical protein
LTGDTSAYEAAVDQITKEMANGSLSAEEGQTALSSLRFSLGNNQIIPGEASSAIGGLADLGGRNLKKYLASVGSTFTKDPISSYPSLGMNRCGTCGKLSSAAFLEPATASPRCTSTFCECNAGSLAIWCFIARKKYLRVILLGGAGFAEPRLLYI